MSLLEVPAPAPHEEKIVSSSDRASSQRKIVQDDDTQPNIFKLGAYHAVEEGSNPPLVLRNPARDVEMLWRDHKACLLVSGCHFLGASWLDQ